MHKPQRSLREIQLAIEAYDEDESNYDSELVGYWANRKPLTDELEAWHAYPGTKHYH